MFAFDSAGITTCSYWRVANLIWDYAVTSAASRSVNGTTRRERNPV